MSFKDEQVPQVYDGFWLPQGIRNRLISPDTIYRVEYRKKGKEVSQSESGAVGARWPEFSEAQWKRLFQYLEQNREAIPTNFISRMQEAVSSLTRNLAEI